MASYYQILGVEHSATSDDIRKAYRSLARERHPDVADGSQESMVKLNQAYEILKDPKTREEYDRTLDGPTYPLPPKPKRSPVYTADPYKFLVKVFAPADAAVRLRMLRLELAIEELAYDIYDDRYVEPFETAFKDLGNTLDETAKKLWASEWPACWNSPINLYLQGMRQLEDGLTDFTDFLESFDCDQLVTGREFLAVGTEILAEARAALGQ